MSGLAGQEKGRNLVCLDLLRAAAILLVVWDHLGPYRQPDWRLGQLVENNFNRPLGIIQSFGALGVCLFFLISGFLLAHTTAEREEGAGRFLLRRLGRLFPPLWASFLSFYLVQAAVGRWMGEPTYWAQFTPRQWVLGGTLLGYFLGEPDVINGTTWYLAPTVLFYILAALLLPLLRRRPAWGVAALETLIAAGILLGGAPGLSSAAYGLLSLFWYLPILAAGMLVHGLWRGTIRPGAALLLGLADYLLLLKGMVLFQPQYYEEQPYLISFVYALLLFCLALLLESKLPAWPAAQVLSRYSYSIYLTHMTYGSLLLTLWTPRMGFTAAWLLTLPVVGAVAVLHYRWVERPVGQWLKTIT